MATGRIASSRDTTSTTESEGASRFAFVLDKNQKGTRNHAMRQYWRGRRRAGPAARREPNRRRLLPKHDQAGSLKSSTDDTSSFVTPSTTDLGARTQILAGLNHALASSRLDPFDTFPVTLTGEHHKLIHHWLSTHATMMFESVPIPAFNPMRDVWLPLDLSNPASFNVMMAHSAAHLAYFFGATGPSRGTNSPEALRFKSDAVRILNQWLDNPEKALGKDAFVAVVRLLTFERYWGTPEEWGIHRNGLRLMIEARGGLGNLSDDWRVELIVGLVSLMSRPSWFESTNDISEISESPIHNTISAAQLDPTKIRSLWLISFIQDIRTLMSLYSELYTDGLSIFPSLYYAVLLLRTDFERESHVEKPSYSPSDYDRLICVFSIAVMIQKSISSAHGATDRRIFAASNLSLLDTSLEVSRDSWELSMHALVGCLRDHFANTYADGTSTINYTIQTINVISRLSLQAQRGVEKCLLNMLCRTRDGKVPFLFNNGWTPDSLLSSMHGH